MLKKFIQTAFLFVVLCTTVNSYAQIGQSPEGIQFQALATDANGHPAAGRVIYVKDAIVAKTATGTIVYSETFKVTASSAGIFTIVLGKGTYAGGVSSIANIDWANGPFFLNLKIAVEPTVPTASWNVNNEYVDLGTSQFWSVPYAMYAGNVKGADTKLNISDTAAMLKPYFTSVNLKANIESPTFTGTVSGITKAMVGLGNVDNTADINKPISTAAQTALDLKANTADVTTALALKANTADVTTALALKANTSDVNAALALKANGASVANSINIINTTLNTKANTIDVNNALIAKADVVAVNNAVAALNASLSNKENSSNKSVSVTTDAASDTKYPSVKAVKTYVDAQVVAGVAGAFIADASATEKGKIQLAGDLAGTAAAPTVPGLALKANAADLVTLTSSVNSNTASITAIRSDLNSEALTARAAELVLTNRVAANTASITTNAADIATLNLNVGSNTASITASTLAITAEVSRATAAELVLTNNVASNTTSITANASDIALKAPLASPTFSGAVTAPIYASTPQLLSAGATINWNPANGLNASVTLNQNSTLIFSSNPTPGAYGTLVVTQGTGGNFTLTLPSTSNKVLGSTSTTAIALSTAAGAKDIINFYYDGTNCYWNVGQGYGTAAVASSTNLATEVTGTLAVGNGGTGATTLTGLVKGNGTSAMTAATAGTDYLAPTGSAASLTNFPTLNQNTTGNAATATTATTATNATTAGNITATSNTTLTSLSNLSSVGTITSGTISLSTNITTTSTITAGTVTYPNAHGAANQVLTTTGSGTLTWTTPASSGGDTYTIGLNNNLGGYVVYVTPDGKHGLVAETVDQVRNTQTTASGFASREIFRLSYLATDPRNHSTAGKNFMDWRIPNYWEMQQVILYKTQIGGFDGTNWPNYFLSISINRNETDWIVSINGGDFTGQASNGSTVAVRTVRSF